MPAPRFPECLECYFFMRSPETCENCDGGDQFEPEELDHEGLEDLRNLQHEL